MERCAFRSVLQSFLSVVLHALATAGQVGKLKICVRVQEAQDSFVRNSNLLKVPSGYARIKIESTIVLLYYLLSESCRLRAERRSGHAVGGPTIIVQASC